MEIIMKLSQGKRIVDDTRSVNTITRTQAVTKDPIYNSYHLAGHVMPDTSIPYYPAPPLVSTL